MMAESKTYVARAIAVGSRFFNLSLQRRIMKYILMMLFVAAVVASLTIAQEKPNMTSAETGLGRRVRVEGTVKAPVAEVWRVWTTSGGAEEFFVEKATIRMAIGGPYELQFHPKNEQSATQ